MAYAVFRQGRPVIEKLEIGRRGNHHVTLKPKCVRVATKRPSSRRCGVVMASSKAVMKYVAALVRGKALQPTNLMHVYKREWPERPLGA